MMNNKTKEFLLTRLDRLFALPGWCLTILFVRHIVKTHAWSDKSIPLKRWTMNRTFLMRQFDVCFWIAIALMLSLFYRHFK